MFDSKKKVSIDFTKYSFSLVEKYREKSNRLLSSTSAVINYLVELFLDLSPEVKKNIANLCSDEIDKINRTEFSGGAFELQARNNKLTQYNKLLMFFTNDKGIQTEKEKTMKRIEMKDGYLFCPDDWIVIDFNNSSDSMYAGVVETKNGAKYNVPHFVFFSPFPINEMDDYDIENLNHKICDVYPEFENILNKVVEPIYDENRELLNFEEWSSAPRPGCFQLFDYGFMPYSDYPYGAMVVRSENVDN